MVESEFFGANRILWLRDFVEKSCRFVDPIFADVNVFFDRPDGSSLAKGRVIQNPALTEDRVERQDFVEGNSEDFVPEKLAIRFVKGFVRTQIVMAERKSFALFVGPESLDSEDVHVVGGDVGVHCFEGRVVPLGKRRGFDGRAFEGTHHFVWNSTLSETFATCRLLAFEIRRLST